MIMTSTGPSETSPIHTYVQSPSAAEIILAITNPPEGRTVHIDRLSGQTWVNVDDTPLADVKYLQDQDPQFRFNWLRIRNTKTE